MRNQGLCSGTERLEGIIPVYISCNPETQARDIRILSKYKYQIKKIVPVDQFPMTPHVETVCLLVRRNSLHIDIDVDVEEMLQ